MPAVLNAANEIAVHAFLKKKIAFYDIPRVIEEVMNSHNPCAKPDLEAILQADAWARTEASKIIIAPGRKLRDKSGIENYIWTNKISL